VPSAYDPIVSADRLPLTDFVIRRSARARHSRIMIEEDATVVVVLPMRSPAREAE
jgi:hypothetical protein